MKVQKESWTEGAFSNLGVIWVIKVNVSFIITFSDCGCKGKLNDMMSFCFLLWFDNMNSFNVSIKGQSDWQDHLVKLVSKPVQKPQDARPVKTVIFY